MNKFMTDGQNNRPNCKLVIKTAGADFEISSIWSIRTDDSIIATELGVKSRKSATVALFLKAPFRVIDFLSHVAPRALFSLRRNFCTL